MNNKYRILSLDGGGIRGIISAVWLNALEKKLGKPIHQCFDLIAGTSTGSILASAISTGIPVQDIIKLYQERGSEIFPKAASRLWSRVVRVASEGVSAPKYSPEGLEACLKDVFGRRTFGSLKTPTLVFTYNVSSRKPGVFKSYRKEYTSFPIWQIVRASCSAPTYFPAMELTVNSSTEPYIDGGVAANNPSACAIAEAIAINNKEVRKDRIDLENFVLASFGTGSATRAISSKEAKEWGAAEWAIPIIDVLFDGSTDTSDYVAGQILGEDRYFRFQVPLDRAYDDLDRADEVNIHALMESAEAYLATEGSSKLDNLLKLIAQ